MIRTTKLTITPAGEPIFSERGFTVEIDDEGAGEFIVVRENDASITGGIRIDQDEWRELRSAIDQMFNRIETNAAKAPQRP